MQDNLSVGALFSLLSTKVEIYLHMTNHQNMDCGEVLKVRPAFP